MKFAITRVWNALGTTGKILLSLTVFYFVSKTLNKH